MAESRLEKYIVRKQAVVVRAGDENMDRIPETDKFPVLDRMNTGPRVIFSNELVANAKTKIEYGYITGDAAVGKGEDLVFANDGKELIEIFTTWTLPDGTAVKAVATGHSRRQFSRSDNEE